MNPFDDEPDAPDKTPWPPLAVYCPECGAYLMTLGLTGPMACDICGGAFEIPGEVRQ